MARHLRREGALNGTSERNRLAAEIRRRREGKATGQQTTHDHGWSEAEVEEMEKGDREFQGWLEELAALKSRLLP